MGGAEIVAGDTLGVEEEFHLVDPRSLALVNRPGLSAQAAAGAAGPRIRAEMLTSQLEAVTDVCTDLAQLRAALVSGRHAAAAAAREHDATILATSTHPFARLAEIDVMAHPRYDRLGGRFGAVVREFNLCGCHVHVSVPDPDTAVAIMNHARPYLPVLAALTGSSPFHEATDTGYDSFRLAQLALWPQGGIPPRLDRAADYLALVDELTRIGLIDDASMLLWELRPSSRYPTLEFRIGDVCPDVEDVLLVAGLIRSLVRVLSRRVAESRPPDTDPGDVALRAARWRAARYGLRATLWSPSRDALVPAAIAVEDLWGELAADLTRHGEDTVLRPLLHNLMGRGTSASAQRRTFAATGSLYEVTRAAVALTAGGAVDR